MLTLTLSGPSAGVSGSLDSYCSLKPLSCHYPVSKYCSASIAVTGTVRVKGRSCKMLIQNWTVDIVFNFWRALYYLINFNII